MKKAGQSTAAEKKHRLPGRQAVFCCGYFLNQNQFNRKIFR